MRSANLVLTALATFAFAACTVGDAADPTIDPTSADVGDQEPLEAGDETALGPITAGLTAGQQARVCNATALNQRSGPSTSNAILKTIPSGSTVQVLEVSGSWVKNTWNGSTGYSSGQYLCEVTTGGTPPGPEPTGTGGGFASTAITRANFLSIGAASVGFSYYWGGGRLADGAPKGSCYGSCPNCTHSGSYGADCSGFIGKTWLLPASLPMDSNKHPYSTASFATSSSLWTMVSRSTLQPGDALNYRSGGSGHIVMYDKNDPWGSFWAYEARGCSYGIVHNIRTAGSAYKGLRRKGV